MTAPHPHAKFWNRIADGYAKKPVADEVAYQKKLEVTRGYLRPDMRVLELGCGTGSTALVHAPHVAHIRAVDISQRMIEIARAKAQAQKVTNVTFECSTVEDLHVPGASVDMVLALSVLHLLRDKERAVADVFEMLVPGGLFVTSTPCMGGIKRFAPLRLILPIGRLFGRLPMVKFFSVPQLERCLTAAGFEIEFRWQPGKTKGVFMVAKKPNPDA